MTKLSLRKELESEEDYSQLLVRQQGGDHGDNV